MLAPAFLTRAAIAEDAYVVRQWTPNEGLPTSTVLDITQTADGYLWVATTGGLARFDGVRFQTFGPRDGLPSNRFCGVLSAHDGTLYAVTEDGWLCHWDGERFRSLNLHRQLGLGSLVETADGSVFGASGQILWRVRRGTVYVYPDTIRWDSRLVLDKGGTLWLTASPGGALLETQQSIPALVDGDRVRQLGPPMAGPGFWLRDGRTGVPVYFQSRGRDAELFDTSLRPLAALPGAGRELPQAIDAGGRLWTTAGPDLVVRSADDGHELRRYRLGLTEPAPRVFLDAQGDAWVCTVMQGLIRVAPSPLKLLRPAGAESALGIVWARERLDGTVITTDFSWNAWRAGENDLLPMPGGPTPTAGTIPGRARGRAASASGAA